MRNWLIASSAFLSLLSCTRNPTLLVTVSNLPSTAKSFQVEAAHGGFATAMDVMPYDLPSPTPMAQTFLLRLPSNFMGDIGVSVGVFDQPGGTGCLVATGSNGEMAFAGPDDQVTISVDPATDKACTGKKPLLLSATPNLGKTAGGETIKLNGWGFKPDGALTMGMKNATFSFVSASQLSVTTPAHAGFGLTTLRFANKDGSFDTRKDLFRFYTDTLAFTTIPLMNSVTFQDTSGFAVGVFDPATTVDLAIALPGTPGKVRVEFTTGGMVLSGRRTDITVGNNPGPIVTGDFDKDGDIDIIVANIDDGTVQLLKNDGSGAFIAGSPLNVGGPGSFPASMAAGDLNGDGSVDLVVGNRYPSPANGYVRVFTNMGDGTLMPIANNPLKVGTEPVSVSIGQLSNDMLPDIAVASQVDNKINTLINAGVAGGLFDDGGQTNYSLTVCMKPTNVKVYDTDGNGKDDMLVSCTNDSRLHIIKNNGFPNISEFDLTTEAMPRNMTLTDLNGDGVADIIVPVQGANRVNIFLNKQGMGFEGVTFIGQNTACASPYQVEVLDVDSDGKADVGVAGLGTAGMGCLAILFNQSL